MQQKRFILALVISAAILLAWSYLFPVKLPPQGNTNISPTAQQQAAESNSPPPQAATSPTQQPAPTVADTSSPDGTPQRTVVIKTPLYEVKLDSRGAVATSWVIKRNKDTGRDLYSAGGNKNNLQPLQLISADGLKEGKAPFLLNTGDPGEDTVLATKNYKINGADADGDEIQITLAPSQSKSIEFALHDDTTGLDVSKSISFKADSYDAEIKVKLTRNSQPIPQTMLAIGPNIGDQGIPRYTFYAVAPEGVAAIANGEVERLSAVAVHRNEGGWFTPKRPEGADRQIVKGDIDWAGVGDTYFAMVAVPSKRTQGLEYRTASYQHEANGTKDERYLITAFIPVPTDDSPTELYVGPKDHNLLTSANQEISQAVRRPVDLEGLVNYGILSSIRRPLAVPILWSIKKLQGLTGSYGVAIILFTVFIYSLFFPLKWQSSRKMKKAQKYAPRMKELQEKLKGMKQNDPRMKELQMEQLRLMKEANPLGGCLPLLIQMPFLFALYSAITISIDFRQASFLWMPDLSGGDPLHLLEIMMAASMIVLQLITPAPSADPLQRKMMAIGMPLFMLYVLWGAPSGLLVYWLVGNIVGFSQQFLINRWTKSEDDEEPPGEKKAEPRSSKKLSPARISQA